MVQLCQAVPGSGNTILTPPKTINPAIRWCFTLNNYTLKDLNLIVSIIPKSCRFGIVAKEVGEQGTPHLQGYIEFKVRRRPLNHFGLKSIHWELAKGSKECNVEYCSKQDPKPYLFPTPYSPIIENFFNWQEDIKRLLNSNPDDRTIHWF